MPLALIDTATGETRWALTSLEFIPEGDGAMWAYGGFYERPALVDLGDEYAVLVQYHWSDCHADVCPPGGVSNEYGLVLLSTADGRPLWKKATIPSVPDAEYEVQNQIVWAVDDRTVLVTVADGLGPGRVPRDHLRMIALDVRTGATLWEQRGIWPVAIAGDVVVTVNAEEAPVFDRYAGDELAASTVVGAVEVATGKARWDLGDTFVASDFVLAAGDIAVVRGVTGKGQETAVVAAGTGEVLATLGGTQVANTCGTDGRTLIACRTKGDLVTTVRVTDRRTVTTDGKVDGTYMAVWHDRIFVDDDFTIDLAGNRIDEDLPGRLVAATDGRLAFQGQEGSDPIAGYVVSD